MDETYLAAAELGLQPLHLACLEGDLEAVILMSCQPGIIDAPVEPQRGVDWRLRETPIKLAALMSHLNIVEFLIEQGATLGQDGLHASSYAGDEGLAARRREFYLQTVGIGQEHPDAASNRKSIYHLLASPGRRSVVRAMRGPRADLGYADYKLAKQGRYIVAYAPVLRVRTDVRLDRSKTIGVITSKGVVSVPRDGMVHLDESSRGSSSGDILQVAHSGYRAGALDDRDAACCLDTNRWNYIALHRVAALLRFRFPANRHDNGARPVELDAHRGRAHAGHVEVLLAAWYALQMVKRVCGDGGGMGGGAVSENGNGGGSGSGSERAQEGMGMGTGMELDAETEWLLARMHLLKKATLGQARSAVIMIDSQPCATCLKFINRLFQYTGIHFSVRGAVGIGPTLATKDKRDNARFDTFGDVFPVSDGEDEEENDEEDDSGGVHAPDDYIPMMHGAPRVEDMQLVDNTTSGTGNRNASGNVSFPVTPTRGETSIYFAPRNNDNNNDNNISPASVPALTPDTSTPLAAPAAQRTTPITPARPRMPWPLPENRVRAPAMPDPFRDIPSRRPANHFELLAEYKKKTPVYDFPGYEGVRRQLFPPRRNLGSPLRELGSSPLALPLPLTGREADLRAGAGGGRGDGFGEREGEMEMERRRGKERDVVVVDDMDDSDEDGDADADYADDAVFSASNSNAATPQRRQEMQMQMQMPGIDNHTLMNFNAYAHEDTPCPAPRPRRGSGAGAGAGGVFLYSSFEPVDARKRERDHEWVAERDPVYEASSQAAAAAAAALDTGHGSDVTMQSADEAEAGGEDEDGYYMIRSLMQQPARFAFDHDNRLLGHDYDSALEQRNNNFMELGNDGIIGQPYPHEHLPPLQPQVQVQEQEQEQAAPTQQSSQAHQSQPGESGEQLINATPNPIPVSGLATRLQQWRYQPQAQEPQQQRQREAANTWVHTAQMFQPSTLGSDPPLRSRRLRVLPGGL
ncbi:hypothetical protein GGR54DRAFT_182540 [Hypoxylon sp. NC1633]|nr:hypothetical protein GGR54DRAFT_182540 [Hypoxylon sp. NC1633]